MWFWRNRAYALKDSDFWQRYGMGSHPLKTAIFRKIQFISDRMIICSIKNLLKQF
jgi:hypothetical protein